MQHIRPHRLLTGYLQHIAQINMPDAAPSLEWIFHFGMLFNSNAKWWGDLGKRRSPHEGLDIACYRKSAGRITGLKPDATIPVMTEGEIINICEDYIGRSIVVLNKSMSDAGHYILQVYAHLHPVSNIEKGQHLDRGEIIASIAGTPRKKTAPPHLHLSIVAVSKSVPFSRMNWQLFTSPSEQIHFINPVYF